MFCGVVESFFLNGEIYFCGKSKFGLIFCGMMGFFGWMTSLLKVSRDFFTVVLKNESLEAMFCCVVVWRRFV